MNSHWLKCLRERRCEKAFLVRSMKLFKALETLAKGFSPSSPSLGTPKLGAHGAENRTKIVAGVQEVNRPLVTGGYWN